MEIVIKSSPEDVAEYAADIVASAVIEANGELVLGLATGSSPLLTYERLADRVRDGRLDLSRCRGFALDEYVGLDPDHPESYRSVIRRTVTEPLGLDPALVHVPDGYADDLDAACARYEQAIRDAGGIGVQFLGIGSNGHVGFNEPTSSLTSRTRIKTLTRRTRDDNARFFRPPTPVPTHCVTQGLGTIGESRRALLLAQGHGKAAAVAAMIEGPLSALCPASVLQLHPRATIVIDEAAASRLQLVDYYREIQAERPEWQAR